jgi:hypothetical protein
MNLQLHPLPTSSFIDSNQPAARPGPMTTVTKQGKEAMARKEKSVPKIMDGPVKGKRVLPMPRSRKLVVAATWTLSMVQLDLQALSMFFYE